MSAVAARRLGLRVWVYDPSDECPAAPVADRHFKAAYDDSEALREFRGGVDVATVEFENVPVAALQYLAETIDVAPSPEILGTCQNRGREKEFLLSRGFPHAAFALVNSAEELEHALGKIGTPSVLKTADFGYDGRGQIRITGNESPEMIWQQTGGQRSVLEAWVEYACEVSVLCARNLRGETEVFPVFENIHANHILDTSIAPARIDPALADEACTLGLEIAEALDLRGILAIELFVTRNGELLVNELAPRPHNSGHLTIEACVTSQFEQHIRAICNFPLGSPGLRCCAAMVNLLGDVWLDGAPSWDNVLAIPDAYLHLYGKTEARAGRKMGHVTCLADNADDALNMARDAKAGLRA
jgi:5-(carboxyamino)imidazole ribonucleotide synthase